MQVESRGQKLSKTKSSKNGSQKKLIPLLKIDSINKQKSSKKIKKKKSKLTTKPNTQELEVERDQDSEA